MQPPTPTLLHRGCSSELNQLFDDGVDARRAAGADVDRSGRMAGQGSQVCVDDVGDEDEVAGLLAIAADLGCLAGEQALACDRDDSCFSRAVLEGTVQLR